MRRGGRADGDTHLCRELERTRKKEKRKERGTARYFGFCISFFLSPEFLGEEEEGREGGKRVASRGKKKKS